MMTDLKQAAQRLIELDGERTPGTWYYSYRGGRCLLMAKAGKNKELVSPDIVAPVDADFTRSCANHAPAIARDYLAKCEEVERLREALKTAVIAAERLRACQRAYLACKRRGGVGSPEDCESLGKEVGKAATALDERLAAARQALGDTDDQAG